MRSEESKYDLRNYTQFKFVTRGGGQTSWIWYYVEQTLDTWTKLFPAVIFGRIAARASINMRGLAHKTLVFRRPIHSKLPDRHRTARLGNLKGIACDIRKFEDLLCLSLSRWIEVCANPTASPATHFSAGQANGTLNPCISYASFS